MTDPGALRTATQGARQPAGLALEDVLVDVQRARPREGTRDVVAQHVQGGVVGVGAWGQILGLL